MVASRAIEAKTVRARARLATLEAWLGVLVLAACGGGGDADSVQASDPPPVAAVPVGARSPAPSAPAPSAAGAPANADRDALPALPEPPADALLVTQSCASGQCAVPDDDADDSLAIQAALDGAKAGQWLVFPAGRYLIDRSLVVRVAGLTLWGRGATLHATNPDDQSILVEADGTSVLAFTLTAATAKRGKTHRHTRIAVYPRGRQPVHDTVIRGNRIAPAGEPGTSLAHGGSASGIFLSSADGFLVAENTVVRTLADAIHVTGGSKNGRVIGNTVRENGDDMIAMVSYAYPKDVRSAREVEDDIAARAERGQVRNVVVARNDLAGQYWGRGLTVVGGRDITIRDNAISNTAHAAAILLVREQSYRTFGIENVVVEGNRIDEVQTQSPPYDFDGKFARGGRTGHAAIEVHSSLSDDEASLPTLRDAFAVKKVAIRGNTIRASATSGIAVGAGNGRVHGVQIENNALADIRSAEPISIRDSAVAHCAGNSVDQAALAVARCDAAPAATSIAGAGG